MVISIIAVLAALLFPALTKTQRQSQMTAGLAAIRQVGVGFQLYANDHNYTVPGRVSQGDKWPALLLPYLQSADAYASPADPQNWKQRHLQAADAISNSRNNTSYIMNGYNDLGAYSTPGSVTEVRIIRFTDPSNTLLLGTPKTGMTHFYMDFEEPPNGNQKDVLNLTQSEDGPEAQKSRNAGSNYVFSDGSARFIRKIDYRDDMWLADKSWQIPTIGK